MANSHRGPRFGTSSPGLLAPKLLHSIRDKPNRTENSGPMGALHRRGRDSALPCVVDAAPVRSVNHGAVFDPPFRNRPHISQKRRGEHSAVSEPEMMGVATDDHGGDHSGNIFARFFRQRVYPIQVPEVALLDRVVDRVHDGLLNLRGPQVVCR
jgi:hypothetical protein